MKSNVEPGVGWLLLVHQLPSEPSRARVKIWRRLQGVGAVALKSSVYALPDTAETREDFEWIRGEIVAEGGEAMVFAAHGADERSSEQIRGALEKARQSDWADLRARCEALVEGLSGDDAGAAAGAQRDVRTLRARAARIDKIDHLGAPGRAEAMAALERLAARVDPPRADAGADEASTPARRRAADYRDRVWVTRPRPGVDRLASAWLIRRFIDPHARIRFGEVDEGDESIPFDMFGAELGHHGDHVTFETILYEFGLGDRGLRRLARIVHELDLRAEAYSDPEAATVERLIDGLRDSVDTDDRLLEHGIAMFEALYVSLLAAP